MSLLSMLGGNGGGSVPLGGGYNAQAAKNNTAADAYRQQIAQLEASGNPDDQAKANQMKQTAPTFMTQAPQGTAGAGYNGLRGLMMGPGIQDIS
jgi:hypothetical protein